MRGSVIAAGMSAGFDLDGSDAFDQSQVSTLTV